MTYDIWCPNCDARLVIGLCQYCGYSVAEEDRKSWPDPTWADPTGSSYVDRSCDTSPAVTPYKGFWKLLALDVYLKIKNGMHRIFDRYDESNAPPGEDPRVTRFREKQRKKFHKGMKKFKYKKGDKSSSY